MLTVASRPDKVHRQQHPTSSIPTAPYLEYLTSPEGSVQRARLKTFPFRLGRSHPSHFIIPSGQISRVHAEIYQSGDHLRVRDVQSTNGTFLNGRCIQDAELTHGDILHLAHQELRFLTQEDEEPDSNLEETNFTRGDLPASIFYNLPLLKDLIRQRLVRTFFQPILTLDSRVAMGYEALGRGTHGKLSARPGELFGLAENCQLAGELSRVFRAVAVREARGLPGRPVLFLNMHPAELESPLLLESMRHLRGALPAEQTLVLEIHEETVTDLPSLRQLRGQLRELDIGLAYDDFGAGQSRLQELTEVPPDFVKLNMTLIRNLHLSAPRQNLVKAIVRVAQDLGVQVLAEGIETEDEAAVCRQLGSTLGQGYLLGHPQAPLAVPDEDTWEVELDSLNRDHSERSPNGQENLNPQFDPKRIAS